MLELGIASIGYGSVESIPVYHYMPGHTATRLVAPGVEEALYHCEGHPTCQYGHGAKAFETIPVPLKTLIARARIWGTPILFLDGPEPLAQLGEEGLGELLKTARQAGLRVGARSLGLAPASLLEQVDFLVIDYVREYALDPSLHGEALLALKQVRGKVWVEVAAYLEEPRLEPLHPLLLALEGSRVPLHVYIRKHLGGGPVRDLYQELSRRLPYVYIHNDLYPYLDTNCPNCGSPIASRQEGLLRVLELRDGKCWKCGAPLDFRGPVRKKTPVQVQVTAREGGVVWYHPSSLARKPY